MLRFLSVAEGEFAAAIAYYNDQQDGLGYRFALEFKRTASRIEAYPQAWPKSSDRSRRCSISGFPYHVLYEAQGDECLIVGVMHSSQDPVPWHVRMADRLSDSPIGVRSYI